MRFILSFKTPDVLDQVLLRPEPGKEMSDTMWEENEKIKAVVRKFVEYGEYIQIRFDTEAGTATVRQIPG